jgi:hypothetical protein
MPYELTGVSEIITLHHQGDYSPVIFIVVFNSRSTLKVSMWPRDGLETVGSEG